MYSDYEKQLTNVCENCARTNKEGFDDYNSLFSFMKSHVANWNNGQRKIIKSE